MLWTDNPVLAIATIVAGSPAMTTAAVRAPAAAATPHDPTVMTTMTAGVRRAAGMMTTTIARVHRAAVAVGGGTVIPKAIREPPRHAGRRNADRRVRAAAPARMTTTMTADARRAPALRRAAATRTTTIGAMARAGGAAAAGSAVPKVTRAPARNAGRKKTDRRVRVRAAAMMTMTMTADVRRASAPRCAAATRMTMIGETARAGAGTVAGTAILKVTREPPRHAGRRNAERRVRATAPAIIKVTPTAAAAGEGLVAG